MVVLAFVWVNMLNTDRLHSLCSFVYNMYAAKMAMADIRDIESRFIMARLRTTFPRVGKMREGSEESW